MGYLVRVDNGNTTRCQLQYSLLSLDDGLTYRVSLSDMVAVAGLVRELLREIANRSWRGF